MPGKRHVLFVAAMMIAVAISSFVVHACPYCPSTDATLSEKLAESDAACIVKFLDSKNGEELSQQTTRFEVLESLGKGTSYRKGQKIETTFGLTALLGDQFLLMGQLKEGTMEWSLPIQLDELGYERNYILKAPSPELKQSERLVYFLRYIDHKTPLISNDAFGEFARSEFKDVKSLGDKIKREKVREWLADPNPQLAPRRAFYGMLLGLCGNDEDANYLEQQILAPIDPEKNRFGIEGMMGGYLLLRGEPGLKLLIEKKLDSLPIDLPADDPRLTDLNGLRMTLSFLWDFCRDTFSEDVLRAAMRRYLDRPDFAEIVVIDLARWKDWVSLDQLINAYGRDPWETRSAQEKIVNFALSCQKDGGGLADGKLSPQAAKAEKFLAGLDPAFVQSVKRTMSPKVPAKPNPAAEPAIQMMLVSSLCLCASVVSLVISSFRTRRFVKRKHV